MPYPNWMRKYRIMNIEEKIRNNAASFDDVRMPEGSRERFEARLRRDAARHVPTNNVRKLRFMTWTSVAAAAVTIIMVVTDMVLDKKAPVNQPQTADNKLVEMRQMYDARMDEAIIDLENVMQNVDDSTRMQINAVIDGLLNTGDVFAELAPLPEEKQMAIAEQIYDNKLRTLELLTDKLNK